MRPYPSSQPKTSRLVQHLEKNVSRSGPGRAARKCLRTHSKLAIEPQCEYIQSLRHRSSPPKVATFPVKSTAQRRSSNTGIPNTPSDSMVLGAQCFIFSIVRLPSERRNDRFCARVAADNGVRGAAPGHVTFVVSASAVQVLALVDGFGAFEKGQGGRGEVAASLPRPSAQEM